MGVLGYIGLAVLLLFGLSLWEPLKGIAAKAFTPALVIMGFYLVFYQRSLALGVLFWLVAMLHSELERIENTFGNTVKQEKLCSCRLEFSIGIDNVVRHPSVIAAFKKLQSEGVIDSSLAEGAWSDLLLRNYKQKYKSEYEHVGFNVQMGMLWKNGEIDLNDRIYHELFIPYDYSPEGSLALQPIDIERVRDTNSVDWERRWEESPWNMQRILSGLTIRLFVVNGILKLQVGKFSERFSPEVVREYPELYKQWETLASFPLLYFPFVHKLPEKYLNLSVYATASHYDYLRPRTEGLKKRKRVDDWKAVVQEVADYDYLCWFDGLPEVQWLSGSHFWETRKYNKIFKRLKAKRQEWQKAAAFRGMNEGREDNEYHNERERIHWHNEYLTVWVGNNAYHDEERRWEKHVSDYYEGSL